jgi:hypothetical protein
MRFAGSPLFTPIRGTAAAAALLMCLQAVRKMMDAKKLESTLNYDSSFGDGNQNG